jgi:2-dehydropantoate 2-reductase
VAVSFHDAHAAWVKAAEGLPVEFKTSMLQSLEAGSPTEIDFINGAVVRWGEKVGVPTPVNRTLVAMVKGIERGLAKH